MILNPGIESDRLKKGGGLRGTEVNILLEVKEKAPELKNAPEKPDTPEVIIPLLSPDTDEKEYGETVKDGFLDGNVEIPEAAEWIVPEWRFPELRNTDREKSMDFSPRSKLLLM